MYDCDGFRPLEHLVTVITNKIGAQKEPNYPYIGLEHIAQESPRLLGFAEAQSSVSINSVFETEDILFGKLRPNLRKSLQASFAGYCSTDILVLRALAGVHPGFASRVFQSEEVFRTACRTAIGTKMPRTSWSNLRNHIVFFPAEPEQRHISEILDTVDAAIQQTEALIAKLKLMKAGLLHDLLTRGLDENGELRDPVAHTKDVQHSTWEQLPKQWCVYRLGAIAEVVSGVTLGRTLDGPATVELPYLRVANVQDGYLDLSDVKTIRVMKTELPRFLLQPGDVLMNEGGDFDKLGRGTVWYGQITPCAHQNHVFRVRVDPLYLLPEFLTLIAGSAYGKQFFVLSSKQSTNLASINSTQLKGFPVPCPSVAEQIRILNVSRVQDDQIRAEEAYRDKLRLLKNGLMDDLLTGRVRVVTEAQAAV